jgi:hypothetical protein
VVKNDSGNWETLRRTGSIFNLRLLHNTKERNSITAPLKPKEGYAHGRCYHENSSRFGAALRVAFLCSARIAVLHGFGEAGLNA